MATLFEGRARSLDDDGVEIQAEAGVLRSGALLCKETRCQALPAQEPEDPWLPYRDDSAAPSPMHSPSQHMLPQRVAAHLPPPPRGLQVALSKLHVQQPLRAEDSRVGSSSSLADAGTAAELAQLREQLRAANARIATLEHKNTSLQADLDAARSELPARDNLYSQLKSSFFKLQTRLSRTSTKLAAAEAALAAARGAQEQQGRRAQ